MGRVGVGGVEVAAAGVHEGPAEVLGHEAVHEGVRARVQVSHHGADHAELHQWLPFQRPFRRGEEVGRTVLREPVESWQRRAKEVRRSSMRRGVQQTV